MSDDGPSFRARFEAGVQTHGLSLTAAEIESQLALAQWLDDGLAGARFDIEPETAPADDVLDLSIFELGARLRDGRLSASALTELSLARIDDRDGDYRAFYAVLEDSARADAAQADAEMAAGRDRGPLHGIPVGIKDLIDVAGVPTTANAPGRADALAENDAEVVTRLREAGAIVIGKLATYEWATVGPDTRGLYPPAQNPWKLEAITGGSSSGCASAVAGGLLRTSVGSDTGGSLRGPAFYCGVVGLKPTYDIVPRTGVLDLAPSLDHVGPISASVGEAGLTLDILSGRTGEASALRLLSQPIGGLRIGYARNWFANDPQLMPEVLAAIDGAVSILSQCGALVREIDLPDPSEIEVAVAAILHAESFELHAQKLRDAPEAYGRGAYLSLAAGVALSAEDVTAARQAGAAFGRALATEFAECDAIVTVGALTTALPVKLFEDGAVWTPMRTIAFNITGNPVLALPVGNHDGLPIGMQIIGRHHDEARIVQIGDAFERMTDHSLQRPPRPKQR